MPVATLKIPSGINAIPLNTIPIAWDRNWFATFIRTWLAPADIRNANAGPGISITGNAVTAATIDVSDSIKELLSQPFVMAGAVVSPDLTDWRTLAAESGVLTLADSGAEEPITVGIAANGIANAKLALMPAMTLKGNNAAGASGATDLTVAQVLTMLGLPTGIDELVFITSTGLSADASLTYSALLQTLTVGVSGSTAAITTTAAAAAGNGTNLVITTSSGGLTSGDGADLTLAASNGPTLGRGGNTRIAAGNGNGTGKAGGNITIVPGRGATQAQDGTTQFTDAQGVDNFWLDQFLNVVTFQGTAATTDTDGFLYIPKVAGPPTGVPGHLTGSYASAVPMRYDTTDNKLYVYNGAWKSVTLT